MRKKSSNFFLCFFSFFFYSISTMDVRLAKQAEIDWINQKYDEIEFSHADWIG